MENPTNIRETSTSTIPGATYSPKTKQKVPLKFVIGAAILLLVTIGGAVAFFLSNNKQDIRQQATGGAYGTCTGNGTQCTNGVTYTCSGGYWQNSGVACSNSCAGALQSCESTSCCSGYVCQGVTGSRVCQQQQSSCQPGETCGGNGGYIGFKCSSLSNGQCLSNPAYFNSFADASSYAGSCGQADQVCSSNHNLCGSFAIFSSGCNGNPPASTPPASTPPVSGKKGYAVANCTGDFGWACDSQNYQTPLEIHGYLDTYDEAHLIPVSAIANSTVGADVASQCGGVAAHDYVFNYPAAFIPPGQHTILVFASGLNSSGVSDNNLQYQIGTIASGKINDCTTVTPTPSPVITPVCVGIKLSVATPKVGDSVTLTCTTVAGTDHYEFQMKAPDGTISNLTATGNVSQAISISKAGAYQAQCRLCTGAAETTCQPYGSF